MGTINIKLEGSFGDVFYCDTAMRGGHSAAIARAVAWLAEQQATAIIKDHNLHSLGEFPPLAPFGNSK